MAIGSIGAIARSALSCTAATAVIYVLDVGTNSIYTISAMGVKNTFSGFDRPFALAFAPDAPTPTAVPEPFTVVGTLIGSAAAFRMKQRLKVTNKL